MSLVSQNRTKQLGVGALSVYHSPVVLRLLFFIPHPNLFLSSRIPIAGYPAITIIIPFKVARLDLFILSYNLLSLLALLPKSS